jgi:DNA-binding NarL/FixJ family response regulator
MPSTIVHLDDHDLFSKGVAKLIQTQFPHVSYIHFKSPEDCLWYISEAYTAGTRITLIITDFNHLGLNGCEFAEQVRVIEMNRGIRTPILLLSMVPGDHPKVKDRITDKVFDYYLPKSANAEEIAEIVQTSLNQLAG